MATKVEWIETPARYIRKGDQFQTGARRNVYTALSDPKPHNSIELKILIAWTDDSDWWKASSTTYFADYTLYRKVVTEVPDEPVQKLDLSGDETVDRLRSIAQYWHSKWCSVVYGDESVCREHLARCEYWKDLYEKERTAKNRAQGNAKKLAIELEDLRYLEQWFTNNHTLNGKSLDAVIAMLQRIRSRSLS